MYIPGSISSSSSSSFTSSLWLLLWIFSVVLADRGRLYTWGDNFYGECALGTAFGLMWTPTMVGGLLDSAQIQSVSSGNYAYTVSDSRNILYSWGYRQSGMLGDGILATTYRNTPARVMGDLTALRATSIASGSESRFFSAIVGGRMYSWGDNTFGALGTGDTFHRATPTLVAAALSSVMVISVATAAMTAYALSSNGQVFSMGLNSNGNLGTNDFTARWTPTLVGKGISSVSMTKIYSQQSGAFAVSASSNVYGFGSGLFGVLGILNNAASRQTATLVVYPVTLRDLSCDQHCVMLGTDSLAYSWGNTPALGLGDGTVYRTTPTLVPSLSTTAISAVSAQYMNSMFIDTLGYLYTTGSNMMGQLGTGDTIDRYTPIIVSLLSSLSIQVAKAGYQFYMAYGASRVPMDPEIVVLYSNSTYGMVSSGTTVITSEFASNAPSQLLDISAVGCSDNTQAVGGMFSSVDATTSLGLAVLPKSGAVGSILAAAGINAKFVRAIRRYQQSGLLIVGTFGQMIWDDASETMQPVKSPGLMPPLVTCAATQAGSNTFFVGGGFFVSDDGTVLNGVASFLGVGLWIPLKGGITNENGRTPGLVLAMDINLGVLFVGGKFQYANGVACSSIAKWDDNAKTWACLSTGVVGTVRAVAARPFGVAYIGGEFSVGSICNLAMWTGAAWQSVGTPITGTVLAMFGSATRIYVGGNFTVYGTSIQNLAMWDTVALTWNAVETPATVPAQLPVRAIAPCPCPNGINCDFAREPMAITDGSLTPQSSSSVQLQWTAPSNRGTALIDYTLNYLVNGVAHSTVVFAATAPSGSPQTYLIVGLAASTLVSGVSIRARNAIGYGFPSSTINSIKSGAAWSLASVSENVLYQGRNNSITFQLTPTDPLSNEAITITGLTGTQTPDNAQLPLYGKHAWVFGFTGQWTQATGRLILTMIPSGQIANTGITTWNINVLNPPTQQAAVTPTMSASGIIPISSTAMTGSVLSATQGTWAYTAVFESDKFANYMSVLLFAFQPSAPILPGSVITISALNGCGTSCLAAGSTGMSGSGAPLFSGSNVNYDPVNFILTATVGTTIPSGSVTSFYIPITNPPAQQSTMKPWIGATNILNEPIMNGNVLSSALTGGVVVSMNSITMTKGGTGCGVPTQYTLTMNQAFSLFPGDTMTLITLQPTPQPNGPVPLSGPDAALFGGTANFNANNLFLTIAPNYMLSTGVTYSITFSIISSPGGTAYAVYAYVNSIKWSVSYNTVNFVASFNYNC